MRLQAAEAKLDPALERASDQDRGFVRVRADADTPLRNVAVRYQLNVPQDGEYAVWIFNRPHSRDNQAVITVGGQSENCRLSRYMWPGKRVEHMYIQGSKMPQRRWYVERVTFARRATKPSIDVFPLKAGRQEIVVMLNVAQQRSRSLDLGDIIVTNDLTWRPDDHDPRTQFVPEE
jgi:hypothetical protein